MSIKHKMISWQTIQESPLQLMTFMKLWQELTQTLINQTIFKKGFLKTGINSLDSEVFTGDDFKGCYVPDRPDQTVSLLKSCIRQFTPLVSRQLLLKSALQQTF